MSEKILGLVFFGGQPFQFTLVDLVLLDPPPQRLDGYSEFLGNFGDGLS
jgi:hypothetical protein